MFQGNLVIEISSPTTLISIIYSQKYFSESFCLYLCTGSYYSKLGGLRKICTTPDLAVPRTLLTATLYVSH